jgi:hypothetical protein
LLRLFGTQPPIRKIKPPEIEKLLRDKYGVAPDLTGKGGGGEDEGNDGDARIEGWRYHEDEEYYSGTIYDKDGVEDGEHFETSYVPEGQRHGDLKTHVLTESGTRYNLGEPKGGGESGEQEEEEEEGGEQEEGEEGEGAGESSFFGAAADAASSFFGGGSDEKKEVRR